MGRRTLRIRFGMVSSGGGDGSGVGEQRWIGSGVQRCAAADQIYRRRPQEAKQVGGRAADWLTDECREQSRDTWWRRAE
ncbi:hypothetical protein Syun_024117 [Stephania yunnanensis]|uniref:Uncharacterized protein n=1 Tax=Stephania yunnanensis TaxID=152371 RepID=A0AAP0I3Q2_9MAGN